MEGLTLLLDAAQTLPAKARPDILGQLSKRGTFFDLANGHIDAPDQLECSMRLLSPILGLPHDMGAARAEVYAVRLKHFLCTVNRSGLRQCSRGPVPSCIEPAGRGHNTARPTFPKERP